MQLVRVALLIEPQRYRAAVPPQLCEPSAGGETLETDIELRLRVG